MARALFVAIGVHNAATMPRLDGVLTAVEKLSGWADDHGYEVVRIDDARERVTVARINEELTPLDAATGDPDPKRLLDRPRIVIYFCGHGLHAPQDQYWILSAGPKQPGERISAVGFRDMLATYVPKQISIISDACRSGLVVQGLASSVVDAYEGQDAVVHKDRFFSSQDGQQSFAVPAKDGKPAYCVFSSVLLRALSKPADPAALDVLYLQGGRMVVSSQSLADYLDRKVPDAALGLGKWQVPQCDPSFRPVTNDYVDFGPVPHADPPAKAAAREAAVEAQRAGAQNDRITRSVSEWRGPYVAALQNYMAQALRESLQRNQWGPLLLSSDAAAPDVEALLANVSPAAPRLDWFDAGPRPEPRPWNVMTLVQKPFAESGRSGVVVVRLSDLFAALPLHRRLWCTAIIDKSQGPDGTRGGIELLAWGDRSPLPRPRFSAAEALKGLSAGTLNAEDTAVWAEDMRDAKHADPMYGIVAAYLYNAIGDVSNIRRMCYYYQHHDQDVPFDIAMLAQLELKRRPDGRFYVEVPEVAAVPPAERRRGAVSYVWEKTPATMVDVAGVIPLLRAGWQHIQASPHAVHKKCWELTPSLTESPISTFQGRDVGTRLVQALKDL
jgi:hypothetical protein